MTAMSEDRYSIARRVAFARPVPVGWSSTGKPPMSHDTPLTESQFAHLLAAGVLRTDGEVMSHDTMEALGTLADARVVIWFCPNEDHRFVTWTTDAETGKMTPRCNHCGTEGPSR